MRPAGRTNLEVEVLYGPDRGNLDGLHDFRVLCNFFKPLPQCLRRGDFLQAKGHKEEFIIAKLSDVVKISFPLGQKAANRTQYAVILDNCIRGFPVQASGDLKMPKIRRVERATSSSSVFFLQFDIIIGVLLIEYDMFWRAAKDWQLMEKYCVKGPEVMVNKFIYF